MTYIVLVITTLMNIFNILLISNNNINQNKKEKILLLTYSMAELVYMIFIVSLTEWTAANVVFVLSSVIIWLLSKAYILVINMNFENIEEEGFIKMQENNDFGKNENKIEENLTNEVIAEKVEISDNQETEVVSEVPKEKLELSDLVESNAFNNKDKILTPDFLYDLADIVESAKINKEEEQRMRRRSLALKASKMMNNEQH